MTLELQREDTRRDAMALLEILRPSMLLVFLVGVPVMLLTRWTFFVHEPDFFERTSPSISKTAAYAPASYLFATGMVATAVFLIISWYIARRIGSRSIDALKPGPSHAPGRHGRKGLHCSHLAVSLLFRTPLAPP